jgi:hypothetical protein
MIANLLSGFVGALLGALSSFCVAVYTNKKQVESIALERKFKLVTEGFLLTGKLINTFRSYKPALLNSYGFAMKIDEQTQIRIQEAISYYNEAKNFTHLLPMNVRSRWIEALNLIEKLSTLQNPSPESIQIAQMETLNYLAYLKNSILDLLEDRELREDVPIPTFDGATLALDEEQ